jgi:asparagine synthase (glutamine-hydrolysing)
MPTLAGAWTSDPTDRIPGHWDHREPGLVMTERGDSVWTDVVTPMGSADAPLRLVMTWDGRLDNVDDLQLQLGDAAHASDREIARSLFLRRGIPGLESLIGDWSLALWDRSSRTLHLARDYMGARPLYFCSQPGGVSWSSDLAELVERCERTNDLSETYAANFMSLRPLPGLTPYDGVHAVPGGTCLSFTADGDVRSRQFWTLRIGDIRFPNRHRYEEELRALWGEAVGARLRTHSTVWAEISGGLDSSSIVCMADRLIARHDVPAPAIRLVSHATLRSPEGDERRFIAEVERQVGVRSEIVGVEDNQGQSDPERAWVTPFALQGVGLATVRRVRAGGGRIVLSGRLGDAIMGCQPDNSEAVFDDVSRGAFITALRNLRGWSRATRKPLIEIAWRLFAPVSDPRDTGVALLAPRLRAAIDESPTTNAVGLRRSKRTLARMVLAYAAGGRLDIPNYPPGIVYTYPCSHRPLVEFVLAIPGDELSAPGATRALMRRALAGLLPPRILNRVSKGYYPPAAFRAARRHVASIVDVRELEVVQRGWIDPEKLRQSLRTFTDGGGETGGDIHRLLRLERWLQARRDRLAIPHRKEVNSHAVLNA